ncbi:hypothetical protein TNCV_3843481 [Trichonephila clavipes]|nr:hypothetical protein TNCV_3843481 [Trichonephila clavipes]
MFRWNSCFKPLYLKSFKGYTFYSTNNTDGIKNIRHRNVTDAFVKKLCSSIGQQNKPLANSGLGLFGCLTNGVAAIRGLLCGCEVQRSWLSAQLSLHADQARSL